MFLIILLLIIIVPTIEIVLLFKLMGHIGWVWSAAICVGTGVLGSFLARRQGLRMWLKIREELAGGRVPGDKIIEGLLLLIGGFVLLFPGYLTDAVGFLLLVPGNRRFLRVFIKKHFQHRISIR